MLSSSELLSPFFSSVFTPLLPIKGVLVKLPPDALCPLVLPLIGVQGRLACVLFKLLPAGGVPIKCFMSNGVRDRIFNSGVLDRLVLGVIGRLLGVSDRL